MPCIRRFSFQIFSYRRVSQSFSILLFTYSCNPLSNKTLSLVPTRLSFVPDEPLVCPPRHPRVSPTRMPCVPDGKSRGNRGLVSGDNCLHFRDEEKEHSCLSSLHRQCEFLLQRRHADVRVAALAGHLAGECRRSSHSFNELRHRQVLFIHRRSLVAKRFSCRIDSLAQLDAVGQLKLQLQRQVGVALPHLFINMEAGQNLDGHLHLGLIAGERTNGSRHNDGVLLVGFSLARG